MQLYYYAMLISETPAVSYFKFSFKQYNYFAQRENIPNQLRSFKLSQKFKKS